MKLSIVLAVIFVGIFAALSIKAAFGEHAVIVFGLLGFLGLHLFFKHVMNG